MRLLAVVAVLLLGCKDKQAGAPTGGTGTAGSAGSAGSAAATTTDPAGFAATLGTELTACDDSKLAARLDRDAFTAKLRAANGSVSVAGSAATTAPNLDDAVTEGARIACSWMRGIESYRLVRVDNDTRLLMRRTLPDPKLGPRVDYDKLELSRAGGELRIVDLYSFRQGKWLSEAVAASKLPHPDMEKARELIGAGKQDEAMAIVDKLPTHLRRDLLVRAFVNASFLPEQAKAALAELAKAFPDDPAIALTAIDASFRVSDYKSALHWTDVLAKEIGSDAYLSTTRAIAHLQSGDVDRALAAASEATQLEPTFTRAHEVKLDVLITKKQWPEVLALMTELEKNHGMRFEESALRGEPRLAELVAMPEFADWLAKR